MFKGYVLIIISAVSFSLIPIFALFAYENNVNTTTLLFLRFFFASLGFLTYLVLTGKQWRISKKQLLQLFLLGGILYMLQSTFYFTSVKYIPVSLASLLFYLYPIIVALLSFFFNKEAVSKRVIIAISLSLIGIILVLGAPTGSISLIGIYLACGGAVSYSFYILIGDKVTKQLPPLITTTYISLFASISFLISGFFTNTINLQINSTGWIMAACLAFFCSIVAMLTLFVGMNIVGPTKSSILSMIEPISTIVLSTILFAERMSIPQIIGTLIVISGTILVLLARDSKQLENKVYQSKIS